MVVVSQYASCLKCHVDRLQHIVTEPYKGQGLQNSAKWTRTSSRHAIKHKFLIVALKKKTEKKDEIFQTWLLYIKFNSLLPAFQLGPSGQECLSLF